MEALKRGNQNATGAALVGIVDLEILPFQVDWTFHYYAIMTSGMECGFIHQSRRDKLPSHGTSDSVNQYQAPHFDFHASSAGNAPINCQTVSRLSPRRPATHSMLP